MHRIPLAERCLKDFTTLFLFLTVNLKPYLYFLPISSPHKYLNLLSDKRLTSNSYFYIYFFSIQFIIINALMVRLKNWLNSVQICTQAN